MGWWWWWGSGSGAAPAEPPGTDTPPTPPSPSPKYRVQVFAFSGTFGIGALLAEFENAKAIGWGDYANEVPEAFFTINQDDPKIVLLRAVEGRCHVRIWRNDDIVWTGWGALEVDASERDAIVYCYGYLAGLFWSLTNWNQVWTNATTKTVVDDLWTLAKTTTTDSLLQGIATGTTEALVTTSGGATDIVLPKYETYHKRILQVYREMAALGTSDTSNTPRFEITHSATPTFNFWKSRGADKTDVVWQYGGALIAAYSVMKAQVWRRNNVFAVGAAPNNAVLRHEYSNATDRTNYGTRQEPAFFSWVRDPTELERGTGWRAARAMRDDPDISIRFHPNAVVPPGATGAGFRLTDRVTLKIDHGIVSINNYYLVSGVEVLWLRGVEHVKCFAEERYAG